MPSGGVRGSGLPPQRLLTGVLTATSAVRGLDWNVLFILAGSVGLGNVVVSSGLADLISEAIRYLSAGSVLLVVIVFVLTTALMTNLVTNAATAAILTPVALAIAPELGLDPVLLLALIGTCISFTLLNPFSHQSNLMVMGPGGYTNTSFARFGTRYFLRAPEVGVQASGSRHDSRLLLSMITEVLSPGIAGRV